MSKEKKLIKDTIIYTVGNLGSKLLTFILLPIYTKYLLSNEYGYFDLLINTVSLVLPIITFQITDGIYRFVLEEKNENQIKKYISNGIGIVAINTMFFTIVYLIIWSVFKFNNSISIYMYIISMILYTLWSQIARGLQQNLQYAIAGVIVTVIAMILNILFIIVFKLGVTSLIISYIIAFLIAFLYLEKKCGIIKYTKYKYMDTGIKSELYKYSIPLIPTAISWWIMSVSDRYVVTYFLGASTNGLYAIANKFPTIIILINSFFYLAWQESSILEYNNNDRDYYYTKMFNSYMRLQLTGTIVLIAFTQIIFRLLIKGQFFESYKVVPILYAATLFSAFSSFYGTGYLSAKDTKGAFNTTIIGAVLNLLVSLIMIPILGLYGAALSTLLSYLLVWIIRIKQTKKYFKIRVDYRLFSILISLLIVFIGLFYANNDLLNVVMIILSISIFIIFNKALLNNILRIILRK